MDTKAPKNTYILEILNMIERYSKKEKPVNIIISGMSCSGKTTLARNLEEVAAGAATIHQDDYFKNLNDLPRYNGYVSCDGLDAFRLKRFIDDANSIMGFASIKGPLYDISNNRVVEDYAVYKKPEFIRIYEGLHTGILLNTGIALPEDIQVPVADKIIPVVGEKIHVHLQPGYEECLRRRIDRDTKTFGLPAIKVKKYFDEVIWPVYERYDRLQAEMCDYLIKEK